MAHWKDSGAVAFKTSDNLLPDIILEDEKIRKICLGVYLPLKGLIGQIYTLCGYSDSVSSDTGGETRCTFTESRGELSTHTSS